MVDIEKRRADRLRVMRAIFEASGGSENMHVTGQQLLEETGLSDRDLADVCKYLIGERLATSGGGHWGHLTPYWMTITHRGIKEMEQSLEAPNRPTEHFPAAVTITTFNGPVVNSAVQSGSPGAQQTFSAGDLDLAEVAKFVEQYEASADRLELSEDTAAELSAEIATIRAQAASPKPKYQIIRSSLLSAKAILENTAGGAAAVGLLDLIHLIHP